MVRIFEKLGRTFTLLVANNMKIPFFLVFFVFTCLVSCGLYASDGNADPCLIKGQVVDAVTKKRYQV